MSDQSLKQLAGLLTRLKCPLSIPADSFQSPNNFELMSSILCWLVQMLDPTIPIQTKIGSEDDRSKLLNSIASELSTRFDICVDMSNLYAADDRAVKELVKVASIIDKALQLADEPSTSFEDEIQVEKTIEATKRARLLVEEITAVCSRLNNLFENECEDGNDRTKALRFLNSVIRNNASARDHCHATISRNVDTTNSAKERLDKQCKILISNQHGMEEKIQKKSIDLERTSKRLESLKHVRPAYMDEYEKLEKDLEVEYERYVVRLRNKDYLAGELSSFNQAAIEKRNKFERSRKRMQQQFREDELRVLDGRKDSEITSIHDESPRPINSKVSDESIQVGSDMPEHSNSSSATPKESSSRTTTNSDGSPSEPSSGDEISFDGSEMTGSLPPDDDGDCDSNF